MPVIFWKTPTSYPELLKEKRELEDERDWIKQELAKHELIDSVRYQEDLETITRRLVIVEKEISKNETKSGLDKQLS